jgi:predicted dehydrogenase
MERRQLLKNLGLAAIGGTIISTEGWSTETKQIKPLILNHDDKPKKPITCIVMGAGGRGNVYAGYGLKYPDEIKIVGVAEPIDYRREKMAKEWNIPKEHQFTTWEHVFNVPKFADALIITTPDDLHYGPAMQGLDEGYDLLLEKVIAQSWKECNDIMKKTQDTGKVVAVCHVLRYIPRYRKMKEIISKGEIGEVVSIRHTEHVEHFHMSHSFVRGNWGNAAKSNPMILSKSCHDTDIIRWLVDKPCQKVSSFGSLKHFNENSAPEGSTARCTDGCAVESTCPYSALETYLRKKEWLGHLEAENHEDETIMRELKNGPYGRCVYRCDNDVVDHQVMNMEFDEQITGVFNMEAFTLWGGRLTQIYGTEGDLIARGNEVITTNFSAKKSTSYDTTVAQKFESGHGGGDYGLMYDFVRAVDARDPNLLTSNIEASMSSHLMGFMAEESRLNGMVKKVNL